jgi:uncharacterized protein YdeI (YjbR/CyaY-like superfamily)
MRTGLRSLWQRFQKSQAGTSGIPCDAVDLPELLVADAAEWRAWLRSQRLESQGVWLVLAKKGTTHPTTLTYDEALDEAICFGWIDGRMDRSGEDEVRRAKVDGRWTNAYAGQATVEVPEDLEKALAANPRARAMFRNLSSANRYAILYRIGSAKKTETRTRRIEKFVEMLARDETIHPQGPRSPE